MRFRTSLLFLLSLSAVAAALLVAEGLVRWTGLASPPVAVTLDEAGFQKYPGAFFPASTKVNRQNPRLPHRVTVNDLGFRGASVPVDRAAVERRVLFLGDSFAWGDFVDDEETLPAQLEARLTGRCPGVRVLNFGVGGTTIDAQQAMMERGLVLGPDLVILMFHDNDLEDLRPPTYWTLMAANREAKSRFPGSLVYPVLRRTALWSLARQALTRADAQAQSPEPSGEIRVHDDLPHLQEQYLQLFEGFHDRLQALGIPLVTTAYPSHSTFTGPEQPSFEWFAETIPDQGLLLVDLLSPLRQSGLGLEGAYLLPHDGHATGAAYRLAAEVLASALLDEFLPVLCGQT